MNEKVFVQIRVSYLGCVLFWEQGSAFDLPQGEIRDDPRG